VRSARDGWISPGAVLADRGVRSAPNFSPDWVSPASVLRINTEVMARGVLPSLMFALLAFARSRTPLQPRS
jgi:hypothetical protein